MREKKNNELVTQSKNLVTRTWILLGGEEGSGGLMTLIVAKWYASIQANSFHTLYKSNKVLWKKNEYCVLKSLPSVWNIFTVTWIVYLFLIWSFDNRIEIVGDFFYGTSIFMWWMLCVSDINAFRCMENGWGGIANAQLTLLQWFSFDLLASQFFLITIASS